MYKKPNKSNLKLLRIAGYTGLAVSSGCLLMQWFMNRKLRQAEYYRRGTEIFMNYPPIVQLFGQPIYFGNPDLGDKENWSTEEVAQFKIPINGKLNRGFLFVKAHRDNLSIEEESNPSPKSPHYWSINHVEVTVDNRPGQKLIVPLENNTQKTNPTE